MRVVDPHVGRRRGAILLEVLVAIVLLATAGIAMMVSLGQAVTTAREMHDRERQALAASAALERIALWPPSSLDARLGSTRFRSFEVQIDRVTNTLYHVTVLDTLTRASIVETTIYQPAPTNAEAP